MSWPLGSSSAAPRQPEMTLLQAPVFASVDRRDVGTDQRCGLLVDATFSTIGVVLLKMRKGSRRSDRVDLVIAVVVKRHVTKESSARRRTM